MTIAAAAYPIDWQDSWAGYQLKIAHWIEDAVGQGADLLVFPEYGAMELASLAGRDVAMDIQGSMRAVSERMEEMSAFLSGLAAQHKVYILGPSGPCFDPAFSRPVNRALFFTPDGVQIPHDKQIMTRWERDPMDVQGGAPLTVMETMLGKIGVLICYDSEFPLLGRTLIEAGAEIILVPSATEGLSGYTRVRVGAMARALEGQCIVVHAPTQGSAEWNEVVDVNTGAAAIYGPPDMGFPENGILAEGRFDTPGWTIAEVDLAALHNVRRDGQVLNKTHWNEQESRILRVTNVTL
ncbi:carbon-nitrogen hydrolase family protein [Aliiroseovarius sp. KMU-50]|uniref:Carbon-nitrogen hydrolase family protein n=1 Tax=Aliiroseovarius salicola TaxID=3009082 RepID=A0ABT4VZV6_9RHOB|nr:carbon-nitrogen hydrolase family protein [Aliiroseovarius sp. KMU-50]MDA5093794.1 carbon-nitrogen hydrolase family protein [Aliiroseovarius sp. KMU-50]